MGNKRSKTVQHTDTQDCETSIENQYEQAKTEIDESLLYLKSCDDYSTKAAMLQLKKLEEASNISSSLIDEYRVKLADYLINKEFAQLFVKIVTSLQDNESNASDDDGHKEQCLAHIKGACTQFTCGPGFYPFTLELVHHGAIALLLGSMNTSSERQTDSKVISTIDTLCILENCVKCPDSIVRTTYRKVNAVPVLMKYLKSHEMMMTMKSLSILACIVNDEESDVLASTEGCIEHLVTILNKAASSDDGKVYYNIAGVTYWDGLYGLIDTMNHLAVNDCNKNEIVKHGGIPVIVKIITLKRNNLEVTAAIETLWKLAFIKSHLDVLSTTLRDAKAVEGKYDNSVYAFHVTLMIFVHPYICVL